MCAEDMSLADVERFLCYARVGRLGVVLKNGTPYVVPAGFGYSDCKVFFHTCSKGLKIDALRRNANVRFEVDEALSDASMFKSVILFSKAEIISDKEEMIPYLQKLIDKYCVSENFDAYMNKPGRNREKELEAVRIVTITPSKVTSKKYVL